MRNGQHPHSKVCALVSGGLDSAVLLHRLLAGGSSVLPCYVRCGLRWEAVELFWLRRFLNALRSPRVQPLRVLTLPLRSVYGAHWSLAGRNVPSADSRDEAVYLPGRNVLLVSLSAIVCVQRRISSIAIGVLRGNPFSDASPRFFTRLSGCLAQALGRPIRVLTPLRRATKIELIRSAAAVPLGLTFSCLRPRGRRHCGRCNKCAERQRAFHEAGATDPTGYAA